MATKFDHDKLYTSSDISKIFDVERRSINSLIYTYEEFLKEFGPIGNRVVPSGGRMKTDYVLNGVQLTFFCFLMKNTESNAQIKLDLFKDLLKDNQ